MEASKVRENIVELESLVRFSYMPFPEIIDKALAMGFDMVKDDTETETGTPRRTVEMAYNGTKFLHCCYHLDDPQHCVYCYFLTRGE